MTKVLISDSMDPRAAVIFRERGIQVDEITGQSPDELARIIGEYDGLAIRSSTKVTRVLARRDRARRGCDEYPVRQFDHNRRARYRADVRARPPVARG